jgi:DNA-directed RNA polymerase subunit K
MGEPDIRQILHGEYMKYTRFERARIIGARALQISFGAPVLVEYPADMLDSIDIAMTEFEKDLIPITVSRS